MIYPIVLILCIIVFCLLMFGERNDGDYNVSIGFFLLSSGGLGIWLLVSLFSYTNSKSNLEVIDNRIDVVETQNKERIDSVLPILEKYPEMEQGIVGDIDPNNFAILGDVYPNLKSNESYNTQAQIVRENIAKVEALQREKLDYERDLIEMGYYLWLLGK